MVLFEILKPENSKADSRKGEVAMSTDAIPLDCAFCRFQLLKFSVVSFDHPSFVSLSRLLRL